MTTAFNKWIPFCGASSKESTRELAPGCISDIYVFRASYLPALNLSIQWTQKPDVDYDRVRGSIAEWRSVAEYLMKDMYVLTPWHSENDHRLDCDRMVRPRTRQRRAACLPHGGLPGRRMHRKAPVCRKRQKIYPCECRQRH